MLHRNVFYAFDYHWITIELISVSVFANFVPTFREILRKVGGKKLGLYNRIIVRSRADTRAFSWISVLSSVSEKKYSFLECPLRALEIYEEIRICEHVFADTRPTTFYFFHVISCFHTFDHRSSTDRNLYLKLESLSTDYFSIRIITIVR